MKEIWKKIPKAYNQDLDGKIVICMVEGTIECSDIYEAYWDEDESKWGFIDSNGVTCEEWNGIPTHYKLANE